uniref:Uncharacterized protein n=1 Tax=Rhipicephalus appendiculatus TaxID=34631 RepID=A0A131YD60_RHIAP
MVIHLRTSRNVIYALIEKFALSVCLPRTLHVFRVAGRPFHAGISTRLSCLVCHFYLSCYNLFLRGSTTPFISLPFCSPHYFFLSFFRSSLHFVRRKKKYVA